MRGTDACEEMTLALVVLPVPGGPSKRTPRGLLLWYETLVPSASLV